MWYRNLRFILILCVRTQGPIFFSYFSCKFKKLNEWNIKIIFKWLDLKDNPLEPELKKAAGECFDEIQCRKCAINVLKFTKEQAAEEERIRQIKLKKERGNLKKFLIFFFWLTKFITDLNVKILK